jgi:hypothetical protein
LQDHEGGGGIFSHAKNFEVSFSLILFLTKGNQFSITNKQINRNPAQSEGQHCISILIHYNDFPEKYITEFKNIIFSIHTQIEKEGWFQDADVTFSQLVPAKHCLCFCSILPSLESTAARTIIKNLNSFIDTDDTTMKLKVFYFRVHEEKIGFAIDLFYVLAFFDTIQIRFRNGLLSLQDLLPNPSIRILEKKIYIAISCSADTILYYKNRIQSKNDTLLAFFNSFLNLQEKPDVQHLRRICRTFLKEK